METILHKTHTRGHVNHGWLDTWHTFSFADYYNTDRIHFGKLRVINDDTILGGGGFGTHPHDNMEIITIVLDGALEHKDSMGNAGVINAGEIQVMSAGTGIRHSEFNHSKTEPVQLLQIWVFPREDNVEPRYDQLTLQPQERKNKLQQIVSPNKDDEGLWIHQDAWFYRGYFEAEQEVKYQINQLNNGAYIFIIDGTLKIGNNTLNKRDGMGLSDCSEFSIKVVNPAEVLIMEIPV